MEPKLYIVTVATENKYYMDFLIESVKKNNGELIILGFGEKWKGFNFKFKKMFDFICNLKDYDIICFVDAYDVICVQDLNLLIEKFYKIKKRENCKMIIGLDKIYDIYHEIGSKIYFGTCNGYCINSGTYICEVINLKKILDDILKNNKSDNSDDQLLITNYCNENKFDIYIDIKNELFLVLANPHKELNIDDNLIFNGQIIHNNEFPFFIHAPAKTCISYLIEKLGYRIDTKKTCLELKNLPEFNVVQISNIIINMIDKYGLYILIIIILRYIFIKTIFK